MFMGKKTKSKSDEAQQNKKASRKALHNFLTKGTKKRTGKDLPSQRRIQMTHRIDEMLLADGIDPKSKIGKERKRAILDNKVVLRDTFLGKIKPYGNVIYKSDYIMIDSQYAVILVFAAPGGRVDKLDPMWGLQMIPVIYSKDLESEVTAKMLYSVSRREREWTEDKLTTATDVTDSGETEAASNGQGFYAMRYGKQRYDVQDMANDVANGASYLDLSIRVVVKATSIELLDKAVSSIRREYNSGLGATGDTTLTRFYGEQQVEYSGMLDPAEDQLGRNFMLSSDEAGGSYPFVTRGLSDPNGAYVGSLAQDVNKGAVIWDTMDFDHLMLVGAVDKAEDLSGKHSYSATAGWGVQFAHDALIANHRVFHIVLNDQKILTIGTDLTDISTRIPMDSGALNFLEGFGRTDDELTIYTVLTQKIGLMVQQFSQALTKVGNENGTNLPYADIQVLNEVLNDFYISKGLWHVDAANNRDLLRLVGIKHEDVPLLREFLIYLKAALDRSYVNARAGYATGKSESLRKIYAIVKHINDNFGDLFDQYTFINDEVVSSARQVIFDLGQLGIRSNSALMAQFINTLVYTTNLMGRDDVLIIHGADQLNAQVNEFMLQRLKGLWKRDIKTILLYDDPHVMIRCNEIFQLANVVLTSRLTSGAIADYDRSMITNLPTLVRQSMASSDHTLYYLRRANTDGADSNVVFRWDSILDGSAFD